MSRCFLIPALGQGKGPRGEWRELWLPALVVQGGRWMWANVVLKCSQDDVAWCGEPGHRQLCLGKPAKAVLKCSGIALKGGGLD